MKSIKRRIAFHFSIQFILLLLFVITVLLIAFFFLTYFIVNQEINRHYPEGVLDTITTETIIVDGDVNVPDIWNEELKKKDMWLQIVNEEGDVIYSVNVPNVIPSHYSFKEITELEHQKSYKQYEITTLIDSYYYDEPYLFIMGFQNHKQKLLNKWVDEFSEGSKVNPHHLPVLKQELKSVEGFLDIVNSDGEVIQRIGNGQTPMKYKTIEIHDRLANPKKYDTAINVKNVNGFMWVLHTESETKNIQISTIQQIIIVLTIIGIVFLIILISLSIWHGIRYGQPLLLFISWLERMKNGQYEEVFTANERKKLFNKKNRIRLRFRLYKEVIQEFYHMAEQLARSEKERERLDQKREEWMAGISHDLRTPLSTIQGYGYMLESDQYEWDQEELQEIGEAIRKKSDYMLELIQDFSFVAKLKQQEWHSQFETFDIISVIHTCLEKYKEYSNLYFDAQDEIFLEGNPQWIERLLDNLVINAIKHNPPETKVMISVEKDDEQIALIVKDNGIGMDEETKERLFSRYYRGTNSEGKVDGSGLGMSIANAIVQAHHGTISVHSQLHQGTMITVYFPVLKNKKIS
ncbi:HAMP domain-containing sensor histidine kinase [Bacillus sp. FJAT-47783]|uniref:sensor histidine kinase n=1 Tax=Bacillus sp. FJAT-47783 TaxID=2922712 RepID=UPI001FAC9E1B|nr:HAMP domain-containing sensor histidine kinase [Bacillus sp. FJAT-47783]